MKKSIALAAIAAVTALAFRLAPGYSITGTVDGLPDGTWLYLRTARPDVDIDSCQVKNGAFAMRGTIAGKTQQVYLHTSKYTNYVSFWLENTDIRIRVKAGEFRKGTITGSATQDENRNFIAFCEAANASADSLRQLVADSKDPEIRKRLIGEREAATATARRREQTWVGDHPGSLIAANVLNIYTTTWGREIVQALYNRMSAEMKASVFGREISDYLALNKGLKLGDHYADFEQMSASGKLMKLSQVKGKYILVDFWASWCGPCREENPNLVKTYARFKDKGFAILGVSLDDDKSRWLKAIRDDKLSWAHVSDLRGDKNRAALMYGINAIPGNFLVNEHGVIIARDLRGENLDKKLEELLK